MVGADSAADYNASFLMFLFTAAGVTSVSFNSAGKLYQSPFKIVYSLIIVILICFGMYFQVAIYLEHRIGEDLIHGLLYFYPMVADNIMSMIIIISSLWGTRIFAHFMNCPDSSFLLESIPKFLKFDAFKIQITASLLLFVVPYLLDIFYYHPSAQSKTVLYQALSYVFVFYNFITLNQFGLILTGAKNIYAEINEELSQFCNKEELALGGNFDLDDIWKISAKSVASFRGEMTTQEESSETLYRLRGKHHQMYKWCRTFNNMFSLTNIGLVAHHSVLGVIHSYWGFRQTLAKERTNDIGELVNSFRSAALSFLSIMWLVMPTSAICAEVDKTSRIIQRNLIYVKDKALYSELMSAVVSYLVILLQYQIMLDEQTTHPPA